MSASLGTAIERQGSFGQIPIRRMPCLYSIDPIRQKATSVTPDPEVRAGEGRSDLQDFIIAPEKEVWLVSRLHRPIALLKRAGRLQSPSQVIVDRAPGYYSHDSRSGQGAEVICILAIEMEKRRPPSSAAISEERAALMIGRP